MCGLACVMLASRPRERDCYQHIWQQFTRLLVCAQARGRDAAGVAIVQRDGHVTLHKDSIRASDLVLTDAYHQLGRLVGDDTAAILGHARQATTGSPKNPANNHPLQLEPIPDVHRAVVGIHNGRIRNDSALFYKYGYARTAEVDSEIIFHLAAEACRFRQMRRLMLRAYLGELLGQAAVVWIMLDEPHIVYVLRKRQPLSQLRDPESGVVYLASLRRCLENTFGETCTAEPLGDEHLYIFETHHDTSDLAQPEVLAIPSPEHEIEELGFDELRGIAQASGYLRYLNEDRMKQ